MNDVEKLIARLIDEHKINGGEAIVLIKAVNQFDQNKSSTIDDLIKTTPIKPWKTQDWKDFNSNSITSISDGTTTVTY